MTGTRCKGRTQEGKPCNNFPIQGSKFCRQHTNKQEGSTAEVSRLNLDTEMQPPSPGDVCMGDADTQRIDEEMEELIGAPSWAKSVVRGVNRAVDRIHGQA